MKASDNEFPSILLVEGAAPATPAAGQHRLFVDTADDTLKRKDSAGVVTPIGAGGSSMGAPCWFEATTSPPVTLTPGSQINVPFHTLSDGVAVGTDAIVSSGSDTTIEIVEDGLYLVTTEASYTGSGSLDNDRFTCYVVLNGDAMGPAYYLSGSAPIGSTDQYAVIPTFPLQLVAGDVLSLAVLLQGGTTTTPLGQTYFVLTRIG